MRIRRGENKRESWWITNNTNNVITIGDLPLVPAIQPEKRADILRFYSREKISHSDILVDLVRDGRISLEKQKIFTDNNLPGDVSSRDIEKAITPAEENEIGAILYHTTEDNVLIKTDLDSDTLQETNIIIDDNNNLFTPGDINLETNKNIFLGDHQDSSIYFDGTDLIIESTNPSFPAALKINNDVEVAGTIKGNGYFSSIITITNNNYTIIENDDIILVNTGGTNRTINLPAAADSYNSILKTGKIYHIKKIDSGIGNVVLNPNDSETIDGDTLPSITAQYESFMMISDGNNWHII